MRSITKIVQPSDVTIALATQFQSEIQTAIESGVDVVLVDLKNVTSVTSAGFIELVKGLKFANQSGCQLLVCSANQQLKMLFELTGLDEFFNIVNDVHEVHPSLQAVSKVTHIDSAKAA